MTEKKVDVSRLRKALDLIRKYGWRKGGYGSRESGFCASGALQFAGCEIFSPEYQAVLDQTGYDAKTGPKAGLSYWNDKKERTKMQVEAAFERAIAANS